MAANRTLAHIAPGEYTATVTWIERIGGRQIDRCREMAPLKVLAKEAILYLDDDGEETLTFNRAANKSVQVYVAWTIEQAAQERLKNRLRNSTRCCYGRTEWDKRGMCETHTKRWMTAQIKREAKRMRNEQVPEPDRAAIEADALARREVREQSQAAGNAEWCRVPRCGGWYVRIEGRTAGDVVTVRSRSGGTSQVRLTRNIADDVWEHAAA